MSERILILLRHAKSSWSTPVIDHERKLGLRGRRDAKAAGRLLAKRDVHPDVVAVSSATRTRETWDLVASQGLSAPDPQIYDELYGADDYQIIDVVKGFPADAHTGVLVGHFPGIPDTVERLAAGRGDSDAWEQLRWKYPTAAMSTLAFDGEWADVDSAEASLLRFDVPRG